MITTLNFPADNFDQDNTFAFEYIGFRGQACTATGYLFDCGEQGIYVMKQSACLKDVYTAKDREERARLNAAQPVRTGDVVTVNGRQYTVKILGNYSDAGRLIPVAVTA
jgi:hypothetical protein